MTGRRVARSERGFTLIELLAALVIGSVITGALFQAVFVGLATLKDTDQRIAGSNDTELAASYFTSDVASAESVSTSGTTSHGAPGVTAPASSTLVSLWSVEADTSFTPPDGMNEAWDKASTGPGARVTVSMADQPIANAGSTGDRVATTPIGSSSIAHSLVLLPSGLTPPARRATPAPPPQPASASSVSTLTLTQPAATVAGDVLLAQVAVAVNAGTTIKAPSGWNVVEQRNLASHFASIVYSRSAAVGGAVPWVWEFSSSVDSAGAIASYSGVSAVGPSDTDINPCGGDTPILLFSWVDRKTTESHQVTYNVATEGGHPAIERRHCTGVLGTPVTTNTLVSVLGGSAGSAFGSCLPTACLLTGPLTVSLTLTESQPLNKNTPPRTYQLRATTRTNK